MRSFWAIGGNDKIVFSVFIAGCVHLFILFGLHFNAPEKTNIRRMLDVTLAIAKTEESVSDAQFTAAVDQRASGIEKDHQNPSQLSQFADVTQQTAQEPAPDLQKSPDHQSLYEENVLTTAQSTHSVHQNMRNAQQQSAVAHHAVTDQQATLMAHLETRLADRKQQYAQLPRIKRFTSVKAKKSSDAAYIYHWVKKIEALGTRHYPAEATRHKLYGSLRLMVSLYANGKVHAVEIMQSSGINILDEAAVRIVHLAAPFAPFPEALQQEADRIEIIRTWYFTQDNFKECSNCITD